MSEVDIDLPRLVERSRGTLLTSAPEIPDEAFGLPYLSTTDPDAADPEAERRRREADRWQMFGVTWLPDGAPNVRTIEADCEVVYDKTARDLPDVVTQRPFGLYDALQCLTLGPEVQFLLERVVHNLDVHASAAIAAQLETASLSGIGLIGNATYTPVRPNANAASSVARSFYALEEYLATVLDGALGVIHIPAAMLSFAPVFWRGDHFETLTGHLVIADSGFTGTATPTGGAGPGADSRWIYATGPVWWKVSPVRPALGPGDAQVRRGTNLNRPLAERFALVAFDPNILAAARVSLDELCCGGSGGVGGLDGFQFMGG